MTPSKFGWHRVLALARKDAADLMRNPGAIVPAVMMVFGSLVPAFLVIIATPMLTGTTLEESGEFAEEAVNAATVIAELTGLTGNALIQTFLFHQFSLLLLLVPIVSAMALATHAVIGEKQSKSLEPILATPISTIEFLTAKTMTPFLFALGLSWAAVALYVGGAVVLAEPGVWQSLLGLRFAIMFAVLAPLIEFAALMTAVIVSSRVNDPRSAQQISALLVLPVTAAFVAQLLGLLVIGLPALLIAALSCALANAVLLWLGVRVFQRERMLTRWV